MTLLNCRRWQDAPNDHPLRRLAPFVADGTALQTTRWADAGLVSMIVVLLGGARSGSMPPAIPVTLALLKPEPGYEAEWKLPAAGTG